MRGGKTLGSPFPSWPTPHPHPALLWGGLPTRWCDAGSAPAVRVAGVGKTPPQEGKSGLKAGNGHTLAHSGPRQTDSTADRWSEGRAASPPIWGRAPGWAGRSSQGPGHALRQRGKGEPPGCRDTGVRRERGQKTGQLLPRRDPREEVRSPVRDSLERRPAAPLTKPQCLEPSQKRAAGPWEHHEGAKPPRGDAPGSTRAGTTASMLGPPGARGDTPTRPPQTTGLAGSTPEPLAMGHWGETTGPGQAMETGPWLQPFSEGPPHPPEVTHNQRLASFFRYANRSTTGQAPTSRQEEPKNKAHVPQTGSPPQTMLPTKRPQASCLDQGLSPPILMSPLAPGAPDVRPAAPGVKVLQDRSMSPLQCGLPNSGGAQSPLPDLLPQTDAS